MEDAQEECNALLNAQAIQLYHLANSAPGTSSQSTHKHEAVIKQRLNVFQSIFLFFP
jgi:hypothetical protein